MSKRIVTKIGDIFCTEFDDGTKGYFQYIANDLIQMNSSVIRAFKTHYPVDSDIKIEDIVKDEVAFYAHTILKAGIQLDFWYKIGKSKDIGENDMNKVVFGYTLDHIFDLEDISEHRDIFNSWVIWHLNDKKWNKVGRLPSKYHSTLELGGVKPACEIKDRMQTGYYKYTSPEYCIVKRVPRPEYHSYLRKETVNKISYYHFVGENIMDSITFEKKEYLKRLKHLSKYDIKFGDINWKYMNFITEKEFILVKEQN